jgi:hypothetical protein
MAPQHDATATDDSTKQNEISKLFLSVEQLLSRAYNEVRAQLLETQRAAMDIEAQKDAEIQRLREQV